MKKAGYHFRGCVAAGELISGNWWVTAVVKDRKMKWKEWQTKQLKNKSSVKDSWIYMFSLAILPFDLICRADLRVSMELIYIWGIDFTLVQRRDGESTVPSLPDWLQFHNRLFDKCASVETCSLPEVMMKDTVPSWDFWSFSSERAATGCLEETISFHEHEFMLTNSFTVKSLWTVLMDASQIDTPMKQAGSLVQLPESSTADKYPLMVGCKMQVNKMTCCNDMVLYSLCVRKRNECMIDYAVGFTRNVVSWSVFG